MNMSIFLSLTLQLFLSVVFVTARVYLTGAPNSRMFQRSHPALAQPVVLADELGVRMCPSLMMFILELVSSNEFLCKIDQPA